MKTILLLFAILSFSSALAETPDISLPAPEVQLIKTTDYIEISGTNETGGMENFTIHNDKAISQFVGFLISDRFTAVPKNLKPEFRSLSSYKIKLFSKGAPVLEFQMIAESVVDISSESAYYMQSDRHSDNLMAPLLRLR